VKNVAVLWTRHSDYMQLFLERIVASGYTVHLIQKSISRIAPYDSSKFQTSSIVSYETDSLNFFELLKLLKLISPHFVMVSSWNSFKYMAVLKILRTNLVLCMDNQWKNTIKQKFGIFLWRLGVYPRVNIFFVAGARQEEFAKKLQWKTTKIVRGLYASYFSDRDYSLQLAKREKDFIFVGRLVSEKGFPQLLEAYYKYRGLIANPWGLKVAGVGPLAPLLERQIGVHHLGFLTSDELAKEYASASAFILPSHIEPWGVVVHDATCFGLPLIVSNEAGATDDLVRDRENGFLITDKGIESIVDAMLRMHTLDAKTYVSFSKKSLDLSRKFSSQSNCNLILREIRDVKFD
jgi:glycosyltransferase involved in cell wall biosynthesis